MISQFVNRKRFADGIDFAERIKNFPQLLRLDAVNFNVPILRLDAHQFIAHAAADEHRASAVFANDFSKFLNFTGKLCHTSESLGYNFACKLSNKKRVRIK